MGSGQDEPSEGEDSRRRDRRTRAHGPGQGKRTGSGSRAARSTGARRASGTPTGAGGTRGNREARPTRRDAPELPDDADPALLAPEVRDELRSLTRLNAETVARHLVAAGSLVDTDPQAALAHARAARATAGRIGAVREAVGIAAYHAGEWAEALAELRAARRITGDQGHLPVMADCERALGRPERALEIARSAQAGRLPVELRIEMRIVESGARRDLGELDAAVVILQGPELDRDRVEPWSARLWYAYADALLAAGRTRDAYDWFVAVDALGDEDIDAADRLAQIDRTEGSGQQ